MAKLILTGVGAIDKRLRKIGDPAASNKILRKAMRLAVRPMASEVKANSPEKSGAFRKAVKVKAGARSRKGFTIRVALMAEDLHKADPSLVGKGGRFYAAAIEWGDSNQEGQAPFRRALDAKRESVRDDARAKILAGIMGLAR